MSAIEKDTAAFSDRIVLRGVRTHNLKNIDCSVPHDALTVVTGVSGSGKSSLAFDTMYAEGQRRYTESLSTYARQFLQQMVRPPVDEVESIRPAVALRQKNDVTQARSTVGTITEIDDHLQLLFTHAGVTTCPDCGHVVQRDTPASAAEELVQSMPGARVTIVAEIDALVDDVRPQLLKQLAAEGYSRLYLDGEAVELGEIDADQLLGMRRFPVVVDRLAIDPDDRQRLTEALEAAFGLGTGRLSVYPRGENVAACAFDQSFRCNDCGRDFVEPQPALFSFNTSLGACDACSGFGRMLGVDFRRVVDDPTRTLREGAIAPWRPDRDFQWQGKLLKAARGEGVPLDIPFRDLQPEHREFVLEGRGEWPGVRGYFAQLGSRTKDRILLATYRGYGPCEVCRGTRLSADALNVRFQGRRMSDIWQLRIESARRFFEELELPSHVESAVGVVLEEIRNRLAYLEEIGLGYLTLDRSSRSLSGGEMQRIHLTTSLGRALTETLYVLDEPTAGLHARDSERLLEVLHNLRDLGNTVVVVEHDPEIIEGADHVLELGPGGGERGGELVFQGPMDSFRRAKTPTSESLDRRIPVLPKQDEEPIAVFSVLGATENNLQNVDVHFPVGKLTAVTGVSGSGKSTLVEKVLYAGIMKYANSEPGSCRALEGFDRFEDLIMMDQSALGRSTRSNPMSYTKAYDEIRKLFSGAREAKMAGISAGDFSFNTPGGRCETCAGLGYVTIEMHFMADVELPCEDCHGRRFGPRVLNVLYRERSIADIFEMTVDEAVEFFADRTSIVNRLEPLQQVGLGYIRLGQSTTTLSGGEAQRLKLATYIAEGGGRSSSDSEYLFIFDEPTVGLHILDVEVLVRALRTLVERGHTVIVIEHNIDFVAQCDFMVDLGPEAGPGGGRIVAQGTPERVAQDGEGHTARYLAEYFAQVS